MTGPCGPSRNVRAKRPPRLSEDEADFILAEWMKRKHDELEAAKAAAAETLEKAQDGRTSADAKDGKPAERLKRGDPPKAAENTGRGKPQDGRTAGGPHERPDISDLRRRRAELKRELRELRKKRATK